MGNPPWLFDPLRSYLSFQAVTPPFSEFTESQVEGNMASQQQDGASSHDKTMAAQYLRCARASDSFATPLVEASGISTSPLQPLVIFDNACGTGVIGSTLYRTLPREKTRNWELLCGDMSPHMLACTEQRVKDEGWTNAETRIIDAQDTKLPSGRYTHVFAAFGRIIGYYRR
jgi:ubiquinone/menaquinone biosynthesis C-methylase UbiE